jgi:uncharacterized SAM-binding protein YcdF (DUF218 family)
MKIIALGMGVPDSSIQILPGFNTREEAQAVGRYLAGTSIRRIILVTHRTHIPRAAATFRKQGFEVIPHAVPWSRTRLYPPFSWGNVSSLQGICHEYVGILVYWMKGWVG